MDLKVFWAVGFYYFCNGQTIIVNVFCFEQGKKALENAEG